MRAGVEAVEGIPVQCRGLAELDHSGPGHSARCWHGSGDSPRHAGRHVR